MYAWLKLRSFKLVFWPSLLALLFVGIQGWLGQQVVDNELARGYVAVHFFNAMMIIGLLTAAAVGSYFPKRGSWNRFSKEAAAASFTVLISWMAGALVAQTGSALVFPDWPLMNGGLLPSLGSSNALVHFVHRASALVTGLAIGFVLWRARKLSPPDRLVSRFAHAAFGFWVIQVVIGGLNVLTRSAPWMVVLHVFVASLLWAAVVATTLLGARLTRSVRGDDELLHSAPGIRAPNARERTGAGGLARIVQAYFFLTKPRIIELLLITTIPAMIVAQRGWPSIWLIVATILGGTLTAGSANAINCYLDRDIDETMDRTSGRPLPRHQVEPRNALVFGIVLGLIGFAWLKLTVNLLAASLAAGAILFYVFVYTIWMKRSTPSNIVIGGAAGAAPVLVGWAAVTGTVDLPALVLFAIVFYWTPPHFWALALRYKEDYSAAGVPMMPVVRGVTETTRQMLLYALLLFAVSLLLYPVAELGVVYIVATLLLGSGFVAQCMSLLRAPSPHRAMNLFRFSITYLTVLFAAMAADRLIPLAGPGWLAPAAFTVAVPIFFASQAAVMFSVLARRSPDETPQPGGALLVEVVWTALPTAVVAMLFVHSWQLLLR